MHRWTRQRVCHYPWCALPMTIIHLATPTGALDLSRRCLWPCLWFSWSLGLEWAWDFSGRICIGAGRTLWCSYLLEPSLFFPQIFTEVLKHIRRMIGLRNMSYRSNFTQAWKCWLWIHEQNISGGWCSSQLRDGEGMAEDLSLARRCIMALDRHRYGHVRRPRETHLWCHVRGSVLVSPGRNDRPFAQ